MSYGAKCFKCSHIEHGRDSVDPLFPLAGLECDSCDDCHSAALGRVLRANGGLDLFAPEVRDAVHAFKRGDSHPLIEQLAAECRAIESESQ